VAIIAVAATLVAVRNLSGAGPGPAVAPTATPTAVLPGGVPRYYVALTDTGTSKGGLPIWNAVLADASTGKRLATFKPPANASFDNVAASSDGRTFVLEATDYPGPPGLMRSGAVPRSIIWYVLRLPLGAVGQARLTRVPIAALVGTQALAVSPDGRTLAVVAQADREVGIVVKASGPTTLRTYSLATGQLVRTWTAPLASSSVLEFEDLTWLDDGHTLAFVYPNDAAKRYVRALNVSSPGTSLIADSRVVFSVPTGHTCEGELRLTSDGKAVICGGFAANGGSCTTGQLALNVYSVATGKLERALYRYQGGCHFGFAMVVWAKSATLAIGLIMVSKPINPQPPLTTILGVGTPGKFTALPATLLPDADAAPNTIAF
jgi:hypothetical protein